MQASHPSDDHPFNVSSDARDVPHEVQYGHRCMELERTPRNASGDVQWATRGVVGPDSKVFHHEMLDYFFLRLRMVGERRLKTTPIALDLSFCGLDVVGVGVGRCNATV